MRSFKQVLFTLVFMLSWYGSQAQVGNVIWEDQFDNLDNWNKITGNGYWGWGNGELEFYKESNAVVAPIPGEPGNNGLRITAKQESGAGIVDQWGNPLNYTSGKLDSRAQISVKYGLIETRVRVPNINVGGWPAVWMLGTANYAWPRNGEIDIMEMGWSQSFRNLHDAHNGGNNLNNSNVNQVVGANAIFYSDDAVSAQNPSGAASISYDPDDDFCRPYYNYSSPLNNRFLTYRTYWDQDSLRFTVIDNGVEYDLYTAPFYIDAESDEFRQPFYFIANLAIGGAFTDAYNLGDPGSGVPVSMPFQADMYIDYIKVMEWNGKGEVKTGPPTAESGTFGVFTDNTPTTNELTPGVDAQIYVWEGTLSTGNIPPFEGSNGISWNTTGKGWFGAGILSVQPVNLFDFGAGNLKFRIKIPSNVSFKIGIIDAWGNQNYVDFPAYQTTYGLVRNGNWGQATIPVQDIRGLLIDLRMLSYEFVILEVNGTACQFALDDIYWEDGIPCNAASNLTASPGYSNVDLSWDPVLEATNYIIEGGLQGGNLIQISTTNNNFSVNNLNANTTFVWRVITECAAGLKDTSAFNTFTTLSCDAPNGLSATNITASSVTLSWNPSPGVAGYQLVGGTGSTIAGQVDLPGAGNTGITINNLESSQTYNWGVYAYCSTSPLIKSQLSAVSNFTTLGAAAKNLAGVAATLNIYPNPSNGSFMIELPALNEGNLFVYDLSGRVIMERNLIDENTSVIEVENLAKGTYMLKLISDSGSYFEKIIVH